MSELSSPKSNCNSGGFLENNLGDFDFQIDWNIVNDSSNEPQSTSEVI